MVSALLLWGITAFGVIIKIAYFSTMSSAVSLSLYLAMGWFGLLGGLVLCKQRGFCFVRPLLLGGICYTAGAIMDLCSWPTPIPGVVHAHDMFHLCVLGGMAFHFVFIWRIARPEPAPAPCDARAGADVMSHDYSPSFGAARSEESVHSAAHT